MYMVSHKLEGRVGPKRRLGLMLALGLLISACAGPGAESTTTAAEPAATTTAAAATSTTEGATTTPVAETPGCGTEEVVLNAYFETGFDLPFKLSEEFTKQYPNVTWDIKQDQFQNLMSATPRLLVRRQPARPDPVAHDGVTREGRTAQEPGRLRGRVRLGQWPAAQLAQNRVAADGTRGSGSLYAMGLNSSLTGVFYNKQLATQVGMTQPPATVAEFEALLAAAKAKGCCRSWSGTPPPAVAVLRSRSNNSWRPTVRRSPSTTGSSRSPALRSTPRRTGRRPSSCSGGSRLGTSRPTPTPSSTRTPTRASAAVRGSSSSTATGRTPTTTRAWPATSDSSSSRRRTGCTRWPRCRRR